MAIKGPQCRGILIRVNSGGAPFRVCANGAVEGVYCAKHAARAAQQTILHALLRPDWAEAQATLTRTLGVAGHKPKPKPVAMVRAPSSAPGQRKKRKPRKPRTPTPPAPAPAPVPPQPAPLQAEKPRENDLAELLPSREDAADYMRKLRAEHNL